MLCKDMLRHVLFFLGLATEKCEYLLNFVV
jgi:hypothetical protein